MKMVAQDRDDIVYPYNMSVNAMSLSAGALSLSSRSPRALSPFPVGKILGAPCDLIWRKRGMVEFLAVFSSLLKNEYYEGHEVTA